MNIAKYLLFAIVAAALIAITGCSMLGMEDRADTVKVGVILPLSGEFAPYGKKVLDGIELAKDQFNDQGGVNGRKIILVVMDNGSIPAKTAEAMRKLVEKHNIPVVIGAYSTTCTLALKPVAMKYKIPVIAPMATNNVVTERNQYMFRSCFSDSFQGRAIACYAFADQHVTQVAVMLGIDENSTYSRDLGRIFSETFGRIGGKVVKTEGFYSSQDSFSAQLKNIQQEKGQGIFMPSYCNDGSRMIKETRSLGISCKLFGGDGWDEAEIFTNSGQEPGDCFFASMFSTEYKKPYVEKFIEDISRKTSQIPGACEAQGFDTMGIVADAMKLGIQPEDIMRGFFRVKNYPGVTGNISINSQRNAGKDIFIKKIVKQDNGLFGSKLVKILTPEQINRIENELSH